ncbi:MAG: DUF1801 domain-containing protein [Gammaproteobacteria bacterium]|nr:DUF1801 domain-containing protein [Gammaproteobacteria bacterium]MDH3372978.1 DUF1801 domain-containing protein [Gammaproteobacteria bacterium]MDH3410433.1 DUF1801 domain-containing protein [Gammaproteobacteria bacterium]MDH3552253.1 DUF1801 domain-containing protein [Gammaproteobacteria bacterium]
MKRHKTVDDYISNNTLWPDELKRLREILLSTGLNEEVKWGMPCYTHDGQNIVGIGAFKFYFGLWFFKGAAIKDEQRVLINAQPGKTKDLRQWRMTSPRDIKPSVIKRYVKEAMQL